MKKETIAGLIAIVAIVAVAMFAGCVEEKSSASVSTPTPTVTPTKEYVDSYAKGWKALVEASPEINKALDIDIDKDDPEVDSAARSAIFHFERGQIALTRAEMHFDGMLIYGNTEDEKRLAELLKAYITAYKAFVEKWIDAHQVIIDRKDFDEAERLAREGARYFDQMEEVYSDEIDDYVRKLGLPEIESFYQ